MTKRLRVMAAVAMLAIVGLLLPAAAQASSVRHTQQSSNHAMKAAPVQGCGFVHKAAVLLKLGTAFGLFHRYLYKPWRAGAFNKGAPHRTSAIVKGVTSTLASVLLARSAIKSMQKCGTGGKIASKLDGLKSKLTGLKGVGAGASTGAVDSRMSGITGDFSSINGLKRGL